MRSLDLFIFTSNTLEPDDALQHDVHTMAIDNHCCSSTGILHTIAKLRAARR